MLVQASQQRFAMADSTPLVVKEAIFDLAHFKLTPLAEVEPGNIFFYRGQLMTHSARNNCRMKVYLSGELAYVIHDIPKSALKPTGQALVLQGDLAVRVRPLSPAVPTAEVNNPQGWVTHLREGLAICASFHDDNRYHDRMPGREAVLLQKGETTLHEGDFILAFEQWQWDWLDARGKPVLRVQRSAIGDEIAGP
jgi:hypothetical protein